MGIASFKKKTEIVRYILRCWARAFPRIAYRSTLGLLFDWRSALDFVNHTLDGIDFHEVDKVLGDASVTELFPVQVEPKIIGPYQVIKSSDTRVLMELVTLACLMQVTKPRTVFEIGTFVGRTTRLFALNAPADA